MENLNPFYEKIASAIIDQISEDNWDSIHYKFRIYIPDEYGQVMTDQELSYAKNGKDIFLVASDKLTKLINDFRSEFDRIQGDQWTLMDFVVQADGDFSVNFGYDEQDYDPFEGI